ncbi:MAG: peptidoglycan transpeptidase, ErfK-YbiS-YhnG family [Candidatus Magasanikbacteria bacterium GW2011_GWA2_56_11]|uniref:Peptidoglycan transpeptidase, ErfK-YbiS-YhnG family n=1 Tax=Candidatus Magasanikbacteria bacterium GW2011_GWA2_56_11 TaxID=1619044 RepID=A0A0G2B7F2_9BACT|nr:MAG: peptidoglycan transpeptidase, ErfK-YbiS-YhnG family [Candidatus Magasanikbacteria bacterium GW2011_GWA2_56_11]
MKYFLIMFGVLALVPQLALGETLDTDADGLSDELERAYYTDPVNPDTDGDGFPDGQEVDSGYSPDGLNDLLEIAFGTDIGFSDSDQDGFSDFTEVMHGYNPLSDQLLARLPRRVEVDLAKQRLYYVVDGKLVNNFPVSTGNPWTPTPPGSYTISRLIPVARYVGRDYDLPNVKWNMQFRNGGYFIHGAYWHNDFGKRTHSHGCVNMRTADAEYLYRYMEPGVEVVVAGQTPKRREVGT